MIVAVAIMYFSLFIVLDIKYKDCGVITTHAFVLAEFSASLYKQLDVWAVHLNGREYFWQSFTIMAVVYAFTYSIYYRIERGNISEKRNYYKAYSD